FFSSRRRHTRSKRDWSSDVCSSDLVALDVARQLVAFRDGALVEYAVNIPVGDVGALEEMRPFLALADRLGRFSVQLDPEHLSSEIGRASCRERGEMRGGGGG